MRHHHALPARLALVVLAATCATSPALAAGSITKGTGSFSVSSGSDGSGGSGASQSYHFSATGCPGGQSWKSGHCVQAPDSAQAQTSPGTISDGAITLHQPVLTDIDALVDRPLHGG